MFLVVAAPAASFKMALSKLPREKSRADLPIIAGAALIGSYRF
jgi:hypothetical protein